MTALNSPFKQLGHAISAGKFGIVLLNNVDNLSFFKT